MLPSAHSAARRHPHHRLRRRPARSTALVAGALLAAGTIGAACTGDGGGGSTARFCAAVDEHRDRLFGHLPEPVTPAAVRELIALTVSVGRSAPLEIESDWQDWTLVLETFYSDTDVEHIKAMGYASQKSALAIDAWLRDNCGAGVGVPIGTVPPANIHLPVPGASDPPTTG